MSVTVKRVVTIKPEVDKTEAALIDDQGNQMTDWVPLEFRPREEASANDPYVGLFVNFADHMRSYGYAVAYSLREAGETVAYYLNPNVRISLGNVPVELRFG